MPKVRKAIIAAAGLGTRFLPQTKAMPKEMLPVLDKPVIQIIVEDIVAGGIEDIIIVTGAQKRALEDHFDRSDELERELRERGKDKEASEIRHIADMANFVYVRQKGEPKGNALPVLNSRHLIGDEPFLVYFADDFFRSEIPQTKQLINAYEKSGNSTISLLKVNKNESEKWGMVESSSIENDLVRIKSLVEKPKPEDSPSDIASVSGYLLTPDILPFVERVSASPRGELELPSAINEYAKSNPVDGIFIKGKRYDTGSKLGWLEAVVDAGLENPEIGERFEKYLRSRFES